MRSIEEVSRSPRPTYSISAIYLRLLPGLLGIILNWAMLTMVGANHLTRLLLVPFVPLALMINMASCYGLFSAITKNKGLVPRIIATAIVIANTMAVYGYVHLFVNRPTGCI